MGTISGLTLEGAYQPLRQDALSIVYVDDQPLSRDCIGAQLAHALPDFQLVILPSPAATGEVELTRQARCYIYNVHSLSIDDEELVQNLGLFQRAPSLAPIVVLAQIDTPENIVRTMRQGVAGYIPMSLSLKVAAEAVRLVLAGGIFMPASALPAIGSGLNSANGFAHGPAALTPRQMEVLRHLWLGEQNKTIAHELHMSEGTVKVHVKHIMKKLHAHNRTQVALMTRQMMGNSRAAGVSRERAVLTDPSAYEPESPPGSRHSGRKLTKQ